MIGHAARELVHEPHALRSPFSQLVDDAEPQVELGALAGELIDLLDLGRQRPRLRLDVGDRLGERRRRLMRCDIAVPAMTSAATDDQRHGRITSPDLELDRRRRSRWAFSSRGRRLTRIISLSPSRRSASPMPTVRSGATFSTS